MEQRATNGQGKPPQADKADRPAPAEAPASWNVRYFTREGFNCQLTLRGENGSSLLASAQKALNKLVEDGCLPAPPQAAPELAQPGAGPSPEGRPDWCPIHGVTMPKHSKNNQVWYSHKAPDGTWCRGGQG